MFEVNGINRRPWPAASMIAFKKILIYNLRTGKKSGALKHDFFILQNVELLQLTARYFILLWCGYGD